MKAQAIYNVPRSILGEGPVWDDRLNALYWVDIIGGKVHGLKDNRVDTVFQINDFVTCVALTSNPNYLLVTLKDRVVLVDVNARSIVKTLAKVDEPSTNRLNDCKVDAAGRLWFGSMDMNEREPSGSLYVLDPSGTVRKVLSGVTISNGIVWSLDNKFMYYIDSPTRKIMVFRFDLDKGELMNKAMDIDLSRHEGIPDGMTIDSEGYLWVAMYGGGRVLRIDPGKRVVIDEVDVPVSYTTSCTFGGDGLMSLYITTARNYPREVEREGDDGKVFIANTEIRGYTANKYLVNL
ncbi:SMP-30/gluconolactonase/LRE family protein [Vulcanisaeta souniana]|uniref:SMP-30/Gluconolactonase/LRE-like region domain-containing protein n=1 Tax=Vulcanisaeta souniana JCM 11219 TaxID=1293586 RepID=A0A830EL33_9CREN|nr:SMP-30/gluconolactonase/LRE family protein [Vulcanisaeta souniana]BDR92634.1 hypothetical protein Vsou_17270 [Vulcanisaeta souniana JCM 11219]GGI87593.1 hypothetical protein GCM10007112_25590 [Vulcanisaeta souniana JCM 11219]